MILVHQRDESIASALTPDYCLYNVLASCRPVLGLAICIRDFLFVVMPRLGIVAAKLPH